MSIASVNPIACLKYVKNEWNAVENCSLKITIITTKVSIINIVTINVSIDNSAFFIFKKEKISSLLLHIER